MIRMRNDNHIFTYDYSQAKFLYLLSMRPPIHGKAKRVIRNEVSSYLKVLATGGQNFHTVARNLDHLIIMIIIYSAHTL